MTETKMKYRVLALNLLNYTVRRAHKETLRISLTLDIFPASRALKLTILVMTLHSCCTFPYFGLLTTPATLGRCIRGFAVLSYSFHLQMMN